MLQSKLFYKTLKEVPKTAQATSHKLLLKGGFISQLASGIYTFLPLGTIVQKKIEDIIRKEMNAIGCQELFMPSLQPKEIWLKSGRWNTMDPPLFKLRDRHKKEFALGSTHEEVITDLVKNYITSYKDLPLALYQIQTKFRNELRFTGGLLRTREFLMKDLYSFHSDTQDFERFFKKVLSAYDKIFKQCGLKAIKSEASGGVFTKQRTCEFQVISDVGEDKINYCPKCEWAENLEIEKAKKRTKCPQCGAKLVEKRSIEVGHTFRLGTKYSKAFDLYFVDKNGKKNLVIMGCYGIGVGRLMATIVEINNDKDGIIWPEKVSPFTLHLIQLVNKREVAKNCEKLYKKLKEKNLEVLFDERKDKSPGEKLIESDLIGIPWRIVLSEKTIKKNSFEIRNRKTKKTSIVKISNLWNCLKKEKII